MLESSLVLSIDKIKGKCVGRRAAYRNNNSQSDAVCHLLKRHAKVNKQEIKNSNASFGLLQ